MTDSNDRAARAVIWDMDGVLVDTGDLHYEAWRTTLASHGVDFTREEFRLCFGLNNTETLKRVEAPWLTARELEEISRIKEERFRELARGRARPLPGVRPWLEALAGWGLAQAIASSAPLPNIEILTAELGLGSFFAAVVAGDSLPGKPDPAVFLEAARRLGVRPDRCVVVEDSIAGVEGAKRAGMACVAVTTTNPARDLARADRVVEGLDTLPPAVVLELLVE